MTVAIPTNHRTEIALPNPTDSAAMQLVEWAHAAEAAYRLAEQLCETQFVPQQYRGKPLEGAAAILAGAEVGLSPMASLRAFDPIQGTPAPKAITLRAIVQGKGHDFRVDMSTDKVATVSGRRKGTTEWQTCTWTIERAQQAGFPAKNPNWKTNPAAMLMARATAELCRWIASDAIMGMPYTAEEIRDSDGGFEPRPAPRRGRVTAGDIVAQPSEPAASASGPTDDGPSSEGLKRMFAALAAVNLTPGDQLGFCSETIGRPIKASGDLTAAEVQHITDEALAMVPPFDEASS